MWSAITQVLYAIRNIASGKKGCPAQVFRVLCKPSERGDVHAFFVAI